MFQTKKSETELVGSVREEAVTFRVAIENLSRVLDILLEDRQELDWIFAILLVENLEACRLILVGKSRLEIVGIPHRDDDDNRKARVVHSAFVLTSSARLEPWDSSAFGITSETSP